MAKELFRSKEDKIRDAAPQPTIRYMKSGKKGRIKRERDWGKMRPAIAK
jgi:hypothetical protein